MQTTRTVKQVKQKQNQLSQAVKTKMERYIEIVNQLKELEKQKEELRQEIIDLNLPDGTYKTDKGNLTISTQTKVVLDNIKVHKKIGTEAYLLISSVSTEKYKKMFGVIDENDIVDIKLVKQLKVSGGEL